MPCEDTKMQIVNPWSSPSPLRMIYIPHIYLIFCDVGLTGPLSGELKYQPLLFFNDQGSVPFPVGFVSTGNPITVQQHLWGPASQNSSTKALVESIDFL